MGKGHKRHGQHNGNGGNKNSGARAVLQVQNGAQNGANRNQNEAQNGANRNQNEVQNVANPNRYGNRNRNRRPQNGTSSAPLNCVHPDGCLMPEVLIYMEDIESGDIEVQRVICKNQRCTVGNWMHLDCFEAFEDKVVRYLDMLAGRARSWNRTQRRMNIWTKKAYDQVQKACTCLCISGAIRKDLDWMSFEEKQREIAKAAAAANNANRGAGRGAGGNNNANAAGAAAAGGENQPERAQQNGAAGGGGNKNKSKAKEQRPTLAISAPIPHPNDNQRRSEPQPCSSSSCTPVDSGNSSSASSSFSFADIASSMNNISNRPRVNSLSSNASGSSGMFSGNSCSPPSPGAIGPNTFRYHRKNSKGLVDQIPERSRNNSESSLFAKRPDMRAFSVLNRVKINNVNIKIDTLGDKSDDVRQLILPVLYQNRINKVRCVCCKDWMQVYDRCPLIDGTFFMSPKPHHAESIRVSGNGPSPPKYLNAVCMFCCTGMKSAIVCRCCRGEWSGIDLVLGSCYNYDIFAASQCCPERRQCGHCRAALKRPNFFSEASASSQCEVCGMIDFHLVHSVNDIFDIYRRP